MKKEGREDIIIIIIVDKAPNGLLILAISYFIIMREGGEGSMYSSERRGVCEIYYFRGRGR